MWISDCACVNNGQTSAIDDVPNQYIHITHHHCIKVLIQGKNLNGFTDCTYKIRRKEIFLSLRRKQEIIVCVLSTYAAGKTDIVCFGYVVEQIIRCRIYLVYIPFNAKQNLMLLALQIFVVSCPTPDNLL